MLNDICLGGPAGGPFYVRQGSRFVPMVDRWDVPTFPADGLWVVSHDRHRMVHAAQLDWPGDAPSAGHMWLRERAAHRAIREVRASGGSDMDLLKRVIQALAGPADSEGGF
jgi:hypothetical protein